MGDHDDDDKKNVITIAPDTIGCLQDLDIDALLGIRAHSSDDGASLVDLSMRYGLNNFDHMPLRYCDIAEAVRSLRLSRSDIIYDVGCGGGRVVLYVSAVVKASICGVEIVSERCEALEAIVRRRAIEGVSVARGDALDMSFTDATVMFVNNPFFSAAADRFLDRMAAGGMGPETRIVAFHSIVRRLRRHPKFDEITVDCGLPAYRFGVFALRPSARSSDGRPEATVAAPGRATLRRPTDRNRHAMDAPNAPRVPTPI